MGRVRTQQEKEEIIEFYKTHSETEVYKQYHMGTPKFLKILAEFGVPRRGSEENKKLTCLHKFGTEYAAQSEIVKKHFAESCLKKYGVTNFAQSELFLERMKKSCQERFNTDNPMQSESIKQRLVTTLANRSPEDIQKSNKKREETCLQKYGFKHVAQDPLFKLKHTQTMLERYGVENNSQLQQFHRTHRSRYLYQDVYFDSSYELIYFAWNQLHNIPVQVKPVTLPYTYKNKIKYYTPDFKVDNQLVEIKGGHLLDNKGNLVNPYQKSPDLQLAAKQKCMLENKVQIISDNVILKYKEEVLKHFGKDFIQEHRVY